MNVHVAGLTSALDRALVPTKVLSVGAELGRLDDMVRRFVTRLDVDSLGIDRDHDSLRAVDTRNLLDAALARFLAASEKKMFFFFGRVVSLSVIYSSWSYEASHSSAAKTASEPIETLSAPDLKYSEATSSAEKTLPSGSVTSRMPPPIVRGTKTLGRKKKQSYYILYGNNKTHTCSEVRRKTSSMGASRMGQLRKLVMLRNVISSAPSSK